MGKYVKKQSIESSESWLTKIAICWFIPWPVRKLVMVMAGSNAKRGRTIKKK